MSQLTPWVMRPPEPPALSRLTQRDGHDAMRGSCLRAAMLEVHSRAAVMERTPHVC